MTIKNNNSLDEGLNEDQRKNLLKYYRDMLLIRRFEERAAQLYGMQLIGGFCHLYIGQEAIAVGMQACMQENDTIITSYRDHGLMIAAGSDPKIIMAELLGREGGCSKGKGGSMHIFDLKKNFYGGHGIVGAQTSLGTGIAFAHKYKDTESLSFTYFGDGAVNQGQLYESFNIAKLWNLPVVYVIENNKYSMGTSLERGCSTTNLSMRGASFEIPGYQVDGMDIFDVIKHGNIAADYSRSGRGPIILEMITYRYRGHSMSDPANYRTKEEVENVKNFSDPIAHLKNYVMVNSIAIDSDLKVIENGVKNVIGETVEYAKNSPFPHIDELYTNIYSN